MPPIFDPDLLASSRPLEFSLVTLSHDDLSRLEDRVSHTRLHVFPHRLVPSPGVAREDLLMTLMATLILPDYHNRLKLFEPTLHNLAGQEMNTPWGDIRPAAVIGASEEGELASNLLVATPCGLRAAGSFWSSRDFTSPLRFDIRANQTPQRYELTPDQIRTSACNTLLLPILAAALPVGIHDFDGITRALQILFARISRLADIGTLSGKAGSDRASHDIRQVISMLQKSWWILPDRGYAPKTWIATEKLRAAAAGLDAASLGRPLWDLARGETSKTLLEMAIGTPPGSGISAHESLRAKARIKTLDAGIEALLPLSMLKPAARKRQEKKRAAADTT